MAKIGPIHQTFYYAVPPAKVFAALTQPTQLKKWFVDQAEIRPRAGAAFRFSWGRYTLNGKVLSVTAPSKLNLAWIDQFEDGKVFETEARFVLRKKGRGTVLKLTHLGFKRGKRWVGLYGAIQSGWAYYLLNLRSVLEHGVDLRTETDALS